MWRCNFWFLSVYECTRFCADGNCCKLTFSISIINLIISAACTSCSLLGDRWSCKEASGCVHHWAIRLSKVLNSIWVQLILASLCCPDGLRSDSFRKKIWWLARSWRSRLSVQIARVKARAPRICSCRQSVIYLGLEQWIQFDVGGIVVGFGHLIVTLHGVFKRHF